jgi:prevent-host-death family protein
MIEVGIRALKQNASAVVAKAAAGETVIITDRGRPVAQMIPLPEKHGLDALIAAGRVRPARGKLTDLPPPEPGPNLSAVLQRMRDEERY